MSADSVSLDYKKLFESLPSLFMIISPDFKIITVSDAYARATLVRREDVAGKSLFEVFPDNPDDPAADGVRNLKASLERVFTEKAGDTMAVQKYDVRRSEADGGGFEEKYWSPANYPVMDANGSVLYAVHIVEEVTEFVKLKQRDEQSHKLTEELATKAGRMEKDIYIRAQEIQQLNKNLSKANRELERKEAELQKLDVLKNEFIANVSHELRTPLTLILAPIEAMLAEVRGDKFEIETNLVRTIHNNGTRLLQMVTSLLDFSKISAEKLEANPTAMDVAGLTKAIFNDFEIMFRQKDLSATMRADSPPYQVMMDRYLFERIVFNLLSNAVKFTPGGGSIHLDLKISDGRLTLSVGDTGIGIFPEEAERLFHRFRQVEGSKTRQFEGTGLGLSLVKDFAELMGGSVRLRSRPGEGSVFTVELDAPQAAEAGRRSADGLPEAKRVSAALVPKYTRDNTGAPNPEESSIENSGVEEPSAPQTPVLREATKPKLPKVLVVEDNPELGEFIVRLLSPFCEVRLTANGEEALAELARWKPDLVLSDIMMPKMDGLTLTRIIKSSKEMAAIPVVLLTAISSRDSLLQGWEAGADEYLSKPFHPKELEARVKSLLSLVGWRQKSERYLMQRDALETFSHIASHDLREPLRKMITYSGMVRSRAKDLLDPQSARHLEIIGVAAQRMYDLLDDLIAYSQIDSDREDKKQVDFNEIVAEVLQDLDEERSKTAAAIHVGDLPTLTVSRSLIGVLFNNLLSNSLKYKSPVHSPDISIRAVQDPHQWLFSLKDNGIGFDPAYKETIFSMFKRLHDKDYTGVGMGLAICRKIVERHGGRIWADSRVGEGATFFFSLPKEKTPNGT